MKCNKYCRQKNTTALKTQKLNKRRTNKTNKWTACILAHTTSLWRTVTFAALSLAACLVIMSNLWSTRVSVAIVPAVVTLTDVVGVLTVPAATGKLAVADPEVTVDLTDDIVVGPAADTANDWKVVERPVPNHVAVLRLEGDRCVSIVAILCLG